MDVTRRPRVPGAGRPTPADAGRQSGFAFFLFRKPAVKTYDIEIQRLKSVRHDKGLIELGADLLVQPRAGRGDEAPSSQLLLPVEHARTLLILLKQQLAELDKLQPRSRRSGRC
jgi:hypothetical protein